MLKRSKRAYARSVSACAIVYSVFLLAALPVLAETPAFKLDIPAESTAQALTDLSTQSGIQILFPFDVASRSNGPALKGNYSVRDAVSQLLTGSGLEIASENERTITLRAVSQPESKGASETPTEVIVTGSHIRGGNPTSPVHTITRKDIDNSGYSQVGDLIRSLPESFSGGQNPGVISGSSINVANANATNASTVNLRGLGPDATLTLLNGHRLTGDSRFQGADISGIPLAAIQRVEVVPDGASALYGSDAVAGVVNFILRKNYDGAELSARLGTTSQGGGDDQTYSALIGRTGVRSYGLLNLEYSDQTGINYGQRGQEAYGSPDNTIMQPQKRVSVFTSAGHDFSDRMKASVDILYSERDTNNYFAYSAADILYGSRILTAAYNITPTLDFGLIDDWNGRLTVNASGSRNRFTYDMDGVDYANGVNKNDDSYIELTSDGTLLTLPSGAVKTAVGLGYRQEGFYSGSYGHHSRHVSYLYGEVLAPLVQPSDTRPWLNELELSVSARTENYSDLGGSTNPKIGLRYMPVPTVTVRATLGKSFKAPSFYQMFSGADAYLYNAASLGGSGTGKAMLLFGGSPDLKPEKSISWTLGADYSPKAVPSLKLSATYFNIDYTDRVVQPVNNFGVSLSDPVYADFVQLNPSVADVTAALAAVTSLYNFTSDAYDPSEVVAIIDDRLQNATHQTATGLDLSYRQSFDIGSGILDLFANGTWLDLRQQSSAAARDVKLSGTVFSAPEFKARTGVSWRDGAWTLNGIINQVAPEDDTSTLPEAEVGSWTTVDANITYAFNRMGTRITLAAVNLLDKAPPYTVSPLSDNSPHFDSTNASIVGRFVSVSVTKAW